MVCNMTLGRRERNVIRICSICGSNTTITDRKRQYTGTISIYEKWHHDGKGGWLCNKCYMKFIGSPRWNKTGMLRRITYKNERLYLDQYPRIGVCNFCRAVKGEINAQLGMLCRRTDRAHFIYHDDDPLKDTLELCGHCHKTFDSGIPINRKCSRCGSTKTRLRDKQYPDWRRSEKGEIICTHCYDTTVQKDRRRAKRARTI